MSTTGMTVQDVAEYLNVDPKTVYRMVRPSQKGPASEHRPAGLFTSASMVKRGDLPGFKVGGSGRFRKEDLDAWIAKQKEAATNQVGEA